MENERRGIRAGITGGIGSGKTTVCQVFESMGVPVYYADYWAKWLLQHDPTLVSQVKKIFGEAAYTDTGDYNRAFIAQIAFSNPEKLAALNAIAHPAVEAHAVAWHREQISLGASYTLKEAALMIESGSHKHLDFLVVVSAPEDLRIERVMKRDGVAASEVRARIQRQMPEAEKIELANAVIINDGHHSLVKQAWEIHQIILKLGKK